MRCLVAVVVVPDCRRQFGSSNGCVMHDLLHTLMVVMIVHFIRTLVDAEEVTWTTDVARPNFSHIPKQRREEIILKRKQKKREWMAKLYSLGKEGKEPANGGGKDGLGSPEEISTIKLDFEDEDELLKWSEALDFDGYLDTWTKLATSNSTEAYIPLNDMDYMEPDDVLVVADSAALFAQNFISSEPFKGGMGVNTVNFRPSDLTT